jgi:23S rRNA pseudouridine1911/1915/1917 synthase
MSYHVQENDRGPDSLIPGIPEGFSVVHKYDMPHHVFDLTEFDPEEVSRLSLTPTNVSLPVALMLVDPIEYPSFSKARKVCRKGNVLIHRAASSSLDVDVSHDLEKYFIGRVGDRVYPGDTVAKQLRMSNGEYPTMSFKQPFELPVVYEDDYFAIVNKPAGVVVYAKKQGGHGTMTIRCCLPFVLTPPSLGTPSVLKRPQPVHRLDKPTSGLLLVAKTKPAMQNLSAQFANRTVKKTYTAIVNGIPFESRENAISSYDANKMGVDVHPEDPYYWQYIENSLEEKEAITLWRSIQHSKSLKARDGTITTIELKPKTGRYHQLRRHLAWVCETPIVGDDEYDGGGVAIQLRERGLLLCSSQVTLEHPYYNEEQGRKIWDSLSDEERFGSGMVFLDDNSKVMVTATINLPSKFANFLMREQQRAEKFSRN